MKEMSHLFEALGQVSQEDRRDAGIFERKLAERMGCARSYLAAIEGRRFQPAIQTFRVMADALSTQSEELIRCLKAKLMMLELREPYPRNSPKLSVGALAAKVLGKQQNLKNFLDTFHRVLYICVPRQGRLTLLGGPKFFWKIWLTGQEGVVNLPTCPKLKAFLRER